MVTSRKEGMLVVLTAKPYKMAKSGVLSNANEVIMKEITYEAEGIAYDIQQLFANAMMDIALKSKNLNANAPKVPEAKDSFDDEESPSAAQVREKAEELKVMYQMNSASDLSKLVKVFTGFVNAGLIFAEGMIPMTEKAIWPTIDRNDRLDLIFSYIAFFVQPLASLSSQQQTAPGK